jgi:hypothetical protein
MKSIKQIKEDAKVMADIIKIRRKLKKANGNELIIMAQQKAEDMELMLKNFNILITNYAETLNRLFELEKSDNIVLGNHKINKFDENESYDKIKEWYNGVLSRWKK